MKKVVAKKSLGQNFLKDEEVIEGIFTVAEVMPTDWVVEVGPGTGALTFQLAKRVEKLLAIELDHELVTRLQTQFVDSKSVSILEGNILDLNLEKILETSGFAEHPYKIVANIPYYITAPIIRTLLSLPSQPQSLTLMVQDEVAKRLAAEPGERWGGRLWAEGIFFKPAGVSTRLELGKYPGHIGWVFGVSVGGGFHL